MVRTSERPSMPMQLGAQEIPVPPQVKRRQLKAIEEEAVKRLKKLLKAKEKLPMTKQR